MSGFYTSSVSYHFGVYGILIGGWASNNKFSLSALSRGFPKISVTNWQWECRSLLLVMMTSTLSLREIVDQQAGWHWNVFYQPLGFLIFIICAFAETNRAPFDLPECETELVGGYHTEFSSMKLGFYLFAEYINMFINSAVLQPYFGGYQFPWVSSMDPGLTKTILSVVVMFGKIFFFHFPLLCGCDGHCRDSDMISWWIWVGRYWFHWQ